MNSNVYPRKKKHFRESYSPDSFLHHTGILCSGSEFILECPNFHTIKVTHARYGRHDMNSAKVCDDDIKNDSGELCEASMDVSDAISCNGHEICRIHSDQIAKFSKQNKTEPCEGVSKYTTLWWGCELDDDFSVY